MNDIQKAHAVDIALQRLERDYRRENRAPTAERVRDARLSLMGSPDSAARLFDIIQSIPD